MTDPCISKGDPNQPCVPRKVRWIGNLVISLIVIAAGVIGAAYITQSSPKAVKRPPERPVPLVQATAVAPGTYPVRVAAMGTVVPAHAITLKSRVSGEILSTHPDFVEGGFIKIGEPVLQIDDEDYRLTLSRKKSALADAQYALKLEFGRQDVAKREWELLNDGAPADALDLELALRKPHLAKARADLTAAEAELRQAVLDLERTTVRAPFNALVRSKHVDRGSQVTPQDALAELVGTDEYWIQATVPVDRLRWIELPQGSGGAGSLARVVYQGGSDREGRVIKLLGDLEAEGRMARLLVEVKDPLSLWANDAKTPPPMLIGEFVRIEIAGRSVSDAFRIPRGAVRDENTLWVVSADDTLDIRRIDALWRDSESVLVREGLEPGDRLIISNLPVPVQGMQVQVETDAGTETASSPPEPRS